MVIDYLAPLVARVTDEFSRQFGRPPANVVHAPGRVNLIGEHTDYNDGFVLPVAIDRAVVIGFSRRADRTVKLYSVDFGTTAHLDLDRIEPDAANPWSNYVRGVARELNDRGIRLAGVDAVITGNVPIGAGLSSSAAIEVASAHAFLRACGATLDGIELALLCQRAENHFVGVNCGIMDQFISTLGQASHALLIDCRDLGYRAVPIGTGVTVLVADTGVRRGLVDSEYNARRAECEEAVRILGQFDPGIRALRDVTPALLAERGDALPPRVRQRARHVVGEIDRTVRGAAVLAAGDLETFGRLMVESHASLRDDYQVSCPELDTMVDLALAQPGVLGSRMTGAGFGGCTVSLVATTEAERVADALAMGYRDRTGRNATIYPSAVVGGAGAVDAPT